ncbi:MAG TPA: type II secretion system protein [Candidatus Obscuribacterales bacterium]
MTLIEMLVSCAIVGLAAAGISGLVLLNNVSTHRLFNKVDNLNQARQVVERIGKDLRMARNVGDVYGVNIQLHDDPVTYGTEGTNSFPLAAPGGNNPHYSGGQTPPAGWPTAPWPGRPYVLSPRTLIVQIPVFDANGFPTKVPATTGNPPVSVDQDNVDTLVYQIIDDPDHPGEFLLQVAGFPGNPTNLKIRSNPPQTILSGIVGPKDPATGEPKVFQYLDRYDESGTPQDTFIGPKIANVTGVVMNLEIRRNDEGVSSASVVGLKSEMYMRNNRLRD